MIVGRDYLLKKSDGPSRPKLFIDTVMVPAAANTVGRFERALEQAARRSGFRSSVILGSGAAAAIALFYVAITHRPSSPTPHPTAEQA